VRLQLELLKPELELDARGIHSTIVLFGGARVPRPETAIRRAATRACATSAQYYDEARSFAR
jgi:predicted Rossmann-fold nucleotide-binding protein